MSDGRCTRISDGILLDDFFDNFSEYPGDCPMVELEPLPPAFLDADLLSKCAYPHTLDIASNELEPPPASLLLLVSCLGYHCLCVGHVGWWVWLQVQQHAGSLGGQRGNSFISEHD